MRRRLLAACLVPLMLPLGVAWLARQERRILAEGVPLDADQLADARALGVAAPERVRVLCLPRLPLPDNRLVRVVALRTGTLATGTVGLSARYGIFLREPYRHERRLLAHELVHTRQYERLGGIRPFLRQYLRECLTVGYQQAPMEWEAIEAAVALCG